MVYKSRTSDRENDFYTAIRFQLFMCRTVGLNSYSLIKGPKRKFIVRKRNVILNIIIIIGVFVSLFINYHSCKYGFKNINYITILLENYTFYLYTFISILNMHIYNKKIICVIEFIANEDDYLQTLTQTKINYDKIKIGIIIRTTIGSLLSFGYLATDLSDLLSQNLQDISLSCVLSYYFIHYMTMCIDCLLFLLLAETERRINILNRHIVKYLKNSVFMPSCIQTFRKIHIDFCDKCVVLNECFNFYILSKLVCAFTVIIHDTFVIFDDNYDAPSIWIFIKLYMSNIYWSAMSFLEIVIIVYYFTSLHNEVSHTHFYFLVYVLVV